MTSKENTERVFAAVDIMNLWHSGREQLGPEVRVNYGRLKDLILNQQLGSYQRKVTLVAYTITSPAKQESNGHTHYRDQPRNHRFLSTLKEIGYEIKNRNLRIEKGLKPFSSDWDVGIAIDAINRVDEYDTFCLVSGDGDYALLLDDLKNRGKYVEVITFQSTASRFLHVSANRITYLTENEIFRQILPNGSNVCLVCKKPAPECSCAEDNE